MRRPLHTAWLDMMAASYGEDWQTTLAIGQQADMKRAFMAGGLIVMNAWIAGEFETDDKSKLAEFTDSITSISQEFDNFVAYAHGIDNA